MAFAFGLALVTGLVFGLAPARHALGADLAPMLHGAHSTADRKRFRLRNSLVAAQVALSLMLVVTAFLFLRSLEKAAHTDPGFETANIQVASVDVSLGGYRDQAAVALAQRFKERLEGFSGVESVAHARMIPLQGSGFGLGGVRVPGVTGPRQDGRFDADWDIVSPGYFETIKMPIVEGRAFRDSDREGAPRVAIVSETFVATGVAGTVRRRTDVHAAGQRKGRTRGRDRRRGEGREVPLHQQRHRRRSSTCRWRSIQPATFEFYVRHAPGRADRARRSAPRWRRSNPTCRC